MDGWMGIEAGTTDRTMGHVTVTVGDRTYRLSCGDGEEARLLTLADHVNERIAGLQAQFGRVDQERLLLMTALLFADELLDRAPGLDVAASDEPVLTDDAPAVPASGARKRR